MNPVYCVENYKFFWCFKKHKIRETEAKNGSLNDRTKFKMFSIQILIYITIIYIIKTQLSIFNVHCSVYSCFITDAEQ